MKLGILGGTFDPVHMGHLIVAQEAMARLELDEVWFVPTGQPWLKAGSRVTGALQRMEMVRLAVEGNERFKACSIEVNREGPSYTVDTLLALQRGEAKGAYLFFILGMDSLATLWRWQQPQRLFDLCSLVAVSRPGSEGFDVATLESVRTGASEEVVIIQGPSIGISGAEVRRRVSQGMPITYWVPESVERYIYEKGLYREDKSE
jgi:nicotinate-nucleotide adenylyltransferase